MPPSPPKHSFSLAVAALAAWMPVCVASVSAQYLAPARTIDLNALRGNKLPNALEPGEMAVDQSRGLVYVAFRRTAGFGVADIGRGTLVRSVPRPSGTAGTTDALRVNEAGWNVLVHDADDPASLAAVNPFTGAVIGAFSDPGGRPILDARVDEARHLVFVANGSDLVRVLDGMSLRPVDSIRAAGMAVGALAFDSARSELLALSNALDNGRIVVRGFYAAPPHTVYRSLSVRAAEPATRILVNGRDRRIALAGAFRVTTLDPAGAIDTTYEVAGGIADVALCEATGTLYLADSRGYVDEGEHGRIGKIHRFVLVTRARDSIRVGRRVRRIAVYQREALLVAGSADDNRIAIVDGYSGNVVSSIDPGESVESLAYDADSAELYTSDAFGDGDAVACIGRFGELRATLRAGSWPASIAFDPVTRAVYAANHFESSISVFPADEHAHPTALRIPGVPEARGDAPAELAFDPASGLLLVTMPEFARWALVDARNLAIVRSGPVAGYSFDADSGLHRLPGAICAAVDRFFVLRSRDRTLDMFRVSDGSFIRAIDLSGMPWDDVQRVGTALYADAASGVLCVGPTRVFLVDGESAGPVFAASSRIVGFSASRARAFGLAVERDSLVLTVDRTDDGTRAARFSLYPFTGETPAVAFSESDGRLFVAQSRDALVREYEFGPVLGLDRPAVPGEGLRISLRPSPADAGTRIAVDVSAPPGSSSEYQFEIFDALGRRMDGAAAVRRIGTAGTVSLATERLRPGWYVLRVRGGGNAASRLFLVR